VKVGGVWDDTEYKIGASMEHLKCNNGQKYTILNKYFMRKLNGKLYIGHTKANLLQSIHNKDECNNNLTTN
jgi:hypothetical protein